MSKLDDLLSQKHALEAQIEAVRREEVGAAIAQVREVVAKYDLTERDIFGGARQRSDTQKKTVAAKYRNPATGETWTGRGKPPKWIADKERDQFLIA